MKKITLSLAFLFLALARCPAPVMSNGATTNNPPHLDVGTLLQPSAGISSGGPGNTAIQGSSLERIEWDDNLNLGFGGIRVITPIFLHDGINGDGSGLTNITAGFLSNDLTNWVYSVAGQSARAFYFTGTTNAGITALFTNCFQAWDTTQQAASTNSITVDGSSVNRLVIAWMSTNTIAQLNDGPIDIDLWPYVTPGGGSVTLQPEIYLWFNNDTTQLVATAASRAITGAATQPTLLTFSAVVDIATNPPAGTKIALAVRVTARTGTSTLFFANGANFDSHMNVTIPAAAGTVTSVGLSLPAELTVSGSPVTSAGTLSAAWANQSANTVFAGPASGSPATPGFRLLAPADIPQVGASAIGSPTPGYVHWEEMQVCAGLATPQGLNATFSQGGQQTLGGTATTPPNVTYTGVAGNPNGFNDSSGSAPGVWQPNLTLNVHAVLAITNLFARTVLGFTSQISPASPTQLSSVDVPPNSSGTNAVYILVSTNNASHYQLVTSDGSASATTVSAIAATTAITTLDLVGNNSAGYVMYVNGVAAATNTTHLPAGAPLAFAEYNRGVTNNGGFQFYSVIIWQAWK